MRADNKKRVGIVGYGHLGQYLVKTILESNRLELAFVWNRTKTVLEADLDSKYILTELSDLNKIKVDLIVEVAHPDITREYGVHFLAHADFMIGSPTALADSELEVKLRAAASEHGLYVPSGAFWGGEDIKKMADRGTLQALTVTMTKHPSSFKLAGDLKDKCDSCVTGEEAVVLYDGPVRQLCPLAPNNVNTMAAAALAAHNLGFDGVNGRIIADPKLTDWHIVEVETWGPGDIQQGTAFHCHTIRRNPAVIGKVTGSATYNSFYSSMILARGKGPGIHLC